MSAQGVLGFKKAVIIGTGSWGTGLASLLANQFKDVVLIARSQETAEEITQQHSNARYLPKITLASNIRGSLELKEAQDADIVLLVVPTAFLRDVATKLHAVGLPTTTPLISCSKGIERGSGKRMSEILREIFTSNPIAALSGPNHAEEVAAQLATCAVVATQEQALGQYLQQAFSAPYFRTYTSQDIAGVELGGALKNVFAIAAGILHGLGLGDNAVAALITRGLAEMTRLGVKLGGQLETFSGLSGVGDLMVTCCSEHSRNNRVGRAIGRGDTLEQATERLGMVAEGIPNTLSIYESARLVGAQTPLIDAVYAILYQEKPAQQALLELLSRDPKPEQEIS